MHGVGKMPLNVKPYTANPHADTGTVSKYLLNLEISPLICLKWSGIVVQVQWNSSLIPARCFGFEKSDCSSFNDVCSQHYAGMFSCLPSQVVASV